MASNKKHQALLRLVVDNESDKHFSRCNASSFNAASPLGSKLRSFAMSLTEEPAKPINAPISDCVMPALIKSRMRDAQVGVMGPSLRDTVQNSQRQIVTDFRFNFGMDIPEFQTLGQRLRWWRKKRGFSVPQLAKRAKIALSTLYGLENGDQSNSSSLGVLAEILKLRPIYLKTGKGTAEIDMPVAADDWPWSFERQRLDALDDTEFELLDLTITHKLEKLEAKHQSRRKKA